MKKTYFGDAVAEFFIFVAASVSAAYNICLAFVWQDNIDTNILSMILICAFFLLITCFFKRAAKFIGIVGGALFAIHLVYIQVTSNAVLDFITSLMVKDYILTQSDAFIANFLRVVVVFAGLVMFFAAKSRAGLIAVFIAEIALVFALNALSFAYSLPALLVFMGCCAVLFIRRTAVLAISKDNKRSDLTAFTAVTAVACAAAILCSQLSYTGLSKKFEAMPKLDSDKIAAKITDLIFPKPHKSGFGDYNPDRTLGASVTYDDTLVMEVQTNTSFYLRGRVYDTYTGKNWLVKKTGGNMARNQSIHFPGYLISLMELDGYMAGRGYTPDDPNWMYGLDLYSLSPLLEHHAMKVTVKAPGQKYLFVPDKYLAIYATNVDGNFTLLRNYPDMMSRTNLPVGMEYSMEFYTNTSAFANAQKTSIQDYKTLMADPQTGAFLTTYNKYAQELRSAYSGTENISERTRKLALELTKNCTNDYDKVQAIKGWLQKNCKYTLSPSQPFFWNKDIVDYFLFTSHEGYCVHFASAMTVMLRAVGIPARYVEGYAAPKISEQGVYEITNRQAHAWTEYFSDLYGFITVDPTPPAALPQSYQKGSGRVLPTGPSSMPSSTLSPGDGSIQDNSAQNASGAAANSKNAKKASRAPLIAAAVGAVLLLLALLYGGKAAYRAVWFHLLSLCEKNKQAVRLYRYFAITLERLGFEKSKSATPEEFANTVRSKIHFGTVDFDRVTQIYEAARFGGREISEEQLETMRRFYHDFMRSCRSHTSGIAFLLKYPLLR